jgi:hypothetical protein
MLTGGYGGGENIEDMSADFQILNKYIYENSKSQGVQRVM